MVLLHVFFHANAIMFLFTVQNQVMPLEVVIFLFFLDLLTKCAGDCQPTCNVTGWGSWSFCRANETQTRDRAYCCPAGITTIDACLQNCSLTPESPDVQSCVYTDPSIITTQADNIVTHGSKYYFYEEPSESNWILNIYEYLFAIFGYWKKMSLRLCKLNVR